MVKKVQEIKELAFAKLADLDYRVKDSPQETLKTIDFNVIPQNSVNDQKELALNNLELNKATCLGKVALSAALLEKHFSNIKLEAGEVLQDWFANEMLSMLSLDPTKKNDPSFMGELLMYEEPHIILLIDGVQFEPLSNHMKLEVKHPVIKLFPIWDAITSSVLVSRAWLLNNLEEKLNHLNQAEKLCPKSILVNENKCELLELLKYKQELLDTLNYCVTERPCARNLYVSYLITGNQNYFDLMVKTYSGEVIKYF